MNKHVKLLIESFFDDIEDDIIDTNTVNTKISSMAAFSELEKIPTKYTNNTKYPDNISGEDLDKYIKYILFIEDFIDRFKEEKYNIISYNIVLHDSKENGYDSIHVKTESSQYKWNHPQYKFWFNNDVIEYAILPSNLYIKYNGEEDIMVYFGVLSLWLELNYNMYINNIIVNGQYLNGVYVLKFSLGVQNQGWINANSNIYSHIPIIKSLLNRNHIDNTKLYLNEMDLKDVKFKLVLIYAQMYDNPDCIIKMCETLKTQKYKSIIYVEPFGNDDEHLYRYPAFIEYLKWSFNNKNIRYNWLKSDALFDIYKIIGKQSVEYFEKKYGKKLLTTTVERSGDIISKGTDKTYGKYIDTKVETNYISSNLGYTVYLTATARFYASGKIENLEVKVFPEPK